MRLAVETRKLLEEFFATHYREPQFTLPRVRLYRGAFARLFTGLLGIGGITLGNCIIVSPSYVARRRSDGAQTVEGWLLVHELTHVLQYRREGWIKFLRKYLGEYFGALRAGKSWRRAARTNAYLNLAAEREARANEQAFLLWWDMKKYETSEMADFADHEKAGAGKILAPTSRTI